MPRKVKVEFERYVPTFSILRQASWHALNLAKENENGRFFNCITTILFSALCLEAYLNHLGTQKLSYWNVLKEKLGPREKLDVLSKVIGLEIDYGCRPYRTFVEIFKFRNKLAHASTEYLKGEKDSDLEEEYILKPLTEWEKSITLENAQSFLDDTAEILRRLQMQAGLQGDPISDTGWYSSRKIHLDSSKEKNDHNQ